MTTRFENLLANLPVNLSSVNLSMKVNSLYLRVATLASTVFILSSCQLTALPEDERIKQEVSAPMQQMTHEPGGLRDESEVESPIELTPDKGKEIGFVYEAFLSPHQEGGEEEDTPALIPSTFKSTAPSVTRNQRQSFGHGILSFTNDLSKAYIHVALSGVNVEEVNMFHIHCGRPGQLGPIIVDFALAGDLQGLLADNVLSLEITNEDLVATAEEGEGLIGAFTAGCPIVPTSPADKVKTIAGMEFIASQGELYFNLHTKGQTYFGDIRGQLHQVEP